MLKTSEHTETLMEALFRAQQKFTAVTKTANNPFFKSKYADLNSILDVVTKPLNDEGIMILQPVSSDGTSNFVSTRLQHVKSGQWLESTLKVELAKAGMQELGSAITYGRRYTLQAVTNLQAEDDDGEASVGRGRAKEAIKKAVAEALPVNNDPSASNGVKTTFRKPSVKSTTVTEEEWT